MSNGVFDVVDDLSRVRESLLDLSNSSSLTCEEVMNISREIDNLVIICYRMITETLDSAATSENHVMLD